MFPWHKEGVDGGEGRKSGVSGEWVVGGRNPTCMRVERRGYQIQGLFGKCVLCWPSDQFMKQKNQAQEFIFHRAGNLLCLSSFPLSNLSISKNISSLRENKHCNLICVPSKSNASFRLLKCKRGGLFSHSRIYSAHKSSWRTYQSQNFVRHHGGCKDEWNSVPIPQEFRLRGGDKRPYQSFTRGAKNVNRNCRGSVQRMLQRWFGKLARLFRRVGF